MCNLKHSGGWPNRKSENTKCVDQWDTQWVDTENTVALLRAQGLHASQDPTVPLQGIKLHEESHKGSKGTRMTMTGKQPTCFSLAGWGHETQQMILLKTTQLSHVSKMVERYFDWM